VVGKGSRKGIESRPAKKLLSGVSKNASGENQVVYLGGVPAFTLQLKYLDRPKSVARISCDDASK
jgi:hypothetical protein